MESEHTDTDKETVNLFDLLGVTDERSIEIRDELNEIRVETNYLTEVLPRIKETYEPDSVIMGVFLAEMILRSNGRLLPPGITIEQIAGFATKEEFDKFAVDVVKDVMANMEAEISREDPAYR